MDRSRLEARLSYVPAVSRHLPELGGKLEALGLMAAEDPATGFLPSVGTIARWEPPAGPGIRVDSGYETGSVVPPFYDPMLAKLIASGATRSEAIDRLERALCEFVVIGVRTNIPYLLAIVRDSAFRAGEMTTGFLAERFAGWKPAGGVPVEVLLALAAEAALPAAPTPGGETARRVRRTAPWETIDGWQNVKLRDE